MKVTHTPSCLLFLLCGMLAGCGDGRPVRVPVSGKILIDGKPLGSGYVRVVPADARAATGQIDAGGNFRLTTFDEGDGCVPGTHRVEVIAYQTISHTAIRWLVPKIYQKASTSGLTVTVEEPTDSMLIELSWEGGKPFVEQSESSGDVDPANL